MVDKSGNEWGEMERLAAHKRPGQLHKAISIVLYRHIEGPRSKFQEPNKKSNSKDQNSKRIEILMQKRAAAKPLWPGYWANTVCTHPLPGEQNLDCAVRRLKEEMGIEMEKEKLTVLYTFYYQADYNQELSEHEFDAVIMGEYKGDLKINPDEVSEARWIRLTELKMEMKDRPKKYAPWPKYIFNDPRLKYE